MSRSFAVLLSAIAFAATIIGGTLGNGICKHHRRSYPDINTLEVRKDAIAHLCRFARVRVLNYLLKRFNIRHLDWVTSTAQYEVGPALLVPVRLKGG